VSQETDVWRESMDVIVKLARIGNVSFGAVSANSASAIVRGTTVAVDLAGLVDLDKERTRIEKELDECEKFIGMQESKLANEDFVKRAPEKVIGVERQKLSDLKEKYAALKKEQEALVS